MAVLQATGAEYLVGIPASRHNPQIVRHAMLYQLLFPGRDKGGHCAMGRKHTTHQRHERHMLSIGSLYFPKGQVCWVVAPSFYATFFMQRTQGSLSSRDIMTSNGGRVTPEV